MIVASFNKLLRTPRTRKRALRTTETAVTRTRNRQVLLRLLRIGADAKVTKEFSIGGTEFVLHGRGRIQWSPRCATARCTPVIVIDGLHVRPGSRGTAARAIERRHRIAAIGHIRLSSKARPSAGAPEPCSTRNRNTDGRSGRTILWLTRSRLSVQRAHLRTGLAEAPPKTSGNLSPSKVQSNERRFEAKAQP